MAIQQINLGSAPSGAGGDTQRAANAKINQNFSNPDHAASRLVGTDTGQVPLNENAYQAWASRFSQRTTAGTVDLNKISTEGKVYSTTQSTIGQIPTIGGGTRQEAVGSGVHIQYYTDYNSNGLWYRGFVGSQEDLDNGTKTFGEWRPFSANLDNYRKTTASASNVFVDTDGTLKRATSSMKYKDLIGQLELDVESYEKAITVKPIIYRSKAEGDPINWHYMSFSAEELGAYEPCLTQWRTHETVHNEETGESEQVELEQKEAEGINLNAICAVLHATNIYQDKKLKELEQRLTALESNNEPIE